MNLYVSDLLAQHYINLDFISKSAGCIDILKRKSSGSTKRIGAAKSIYVKNVEGENRCLSDKKYYEISPDEKETAILFFRDLGMRKISSNSRRNSWKGKLRMGLWVNKSKVGNISIMEMVDSLLSNLPKTLTANGSFLGAVLSAVNIPSRSITPFDGLDYSEEKTQFLMEPYDYVCIDIDYTSLMSSGCSANITLNPESC